MTNLIIISIGFFLVAILFLGLWMVYRKKTKGSKKSFKGLPILAAAIIWAIFGIYLLNLFFVAQATTGVSQIHLEYLIDLPFLGLVSFIAFISYLLV